MASVPQAAPERITEFDAEAQQIARNAVMEIPLFPDLPTRLRKAVGSGPHVDMMQHFVYWFHPRKPKMQKRWTLYKTYQEWHDECGLSDRQVKKGRKILRELGLVSEKKGPHGRVHYRVDWVWLAERLSLDGITNQSDDLEDLPDAPEDEFSLDGITDQSQFGRYSDQSSLDGNSDQPNTGDYAGDYEQENSLLQSGGEPAQSAESPPQLNGLNEFLEHHGALPGDDKRLPENSDPPVPKLAKEVEVKVYGLIFGLPEETDVSRFADRYVDGKADADEEPFTVERIAEKARDTLGSDEPLAAYVPFVSRCLAELDQERSEAVA